MIRVMTVSARRPAGIADTRAGVGKGRSRSTGMRGLGARRGSLVRKSFLCEATILSSRSAHTCAYSSSWEGLRPRTYRVFYEVPRKCFFDFLSAESLYFSSTYTLSLFVLVHTPWEVCGPIEASCLDDVREIVYNPFCFDTETPSYKFPPIVPCTLFCSHRSYRCHSLSSLPSKKRKSIFCTPEQEVEVAKNIHAAGTNAPAATAGVNATLTPAASNTSTAAAAVSVGGNTEPIAPKAEKGSTRKKNANSNAKHDKSVPTPPPPPPLPPSQCLLWTDTVLSTEGHPFLVSFIAAGGAAATEATAVADALATTAAETTPATRGNVGAVDAAAEGVKLRENRSPSASSDTEHHHHPSASTLASATPATSRGPATAAAAAGDTEEGAGAGDVSRMGRAMSILRHRRRQVKETTNLEFDPRQHYARAVNRGDLAKRPRNAELDVMVRVTPPVR